MKAYNFRLPDQQRITHELMNYKGSWVILYFYPKDDTLGCTKEACEFRDSLSEFKKRKILVFGISKDSVISHEKFSTKYSLNFPILSDPNRVVIRAYDAWEKKNYLGKEYESTKRKTIIIDPEGVIQKVYENVNPINHARQILSDISALQAS
jgi:thioredoxin-dependent peroxiredoxin